MSRIVLKNIKLKAFRSFVKQQETGLLPESGVVGIFGKNLDTNGSNGSGKSNLHLTLPYLFGFSHIPATELQSYLTEDPMQIGVEFDFNGKTYEINRGETVSFSENGAELTGAKNTNTKISELLPISLELLDALTFRPQRSMGRFMSMVDSEKKEFLGQLLSLKHIENGIKDSKQKISDIEKEITLNEANLTAIIKNRPIIDELKLFDLVPLNNEIEDLKIKSKFLTNELNILNTKIEQFTEKAQEIKSRQIVFVSPLVKEIEQLTMDCDKLNEGILKEKENRQNEVNKLKKDNNNKEKELRNKFKFTGPIAGFLVETEKTIQSIKQNKCHVCDQEWVSDENRLQVAIASKDLLTEAVQYIETNSSKIDELSKIGPTKDEILVQDLKKVIKTKNEELSKERAEAVAKFEEIKKEEMSKISQVSTPILNEFNEKSSIFEDIESRLNKATLRLAYESGSNKQLVLKINKDTELLSKVNIQIRNYEDKLTLLRNEFNLEMDFQGLLKSFLNNIMEEVLQEIATETNNKLVKLNNTNGVTIQFLTEKITQKNVIKEEIRPVIYKNGKQVSVKSGLSGGQFASIEWAVDLSINNVISRRTGFNPGWLVLDEPFHNHDPITRDSCLELLKQEAQDKLIFIIEHAIETNELFDKRILVESQNDESVIKAVL